jgi:2-keto-4-pentenoate hydratase/2-oxohepta-3-ene-1,7-dioic acid hydratase in catechol pathway
MKYFRVATAVGAAWARAEGDRLRLLAGPPWEEPATLADSVPLAGARLLAPATPSKIVAIGLNYKDHAAERGKAVPAEPLIFLKPPTAVIGPDAPVRKPAWAGRVDHEAELAIVIGRTAHELPGLQAARGYIFGATCANDITARELQERDVQFTRAKSFDTFCPLGPCVATGLELSGLEVIGRVNGRVRQRSTTAQLIFGPEHLVWFVSRVMTLLPGDIICTGTPAGIGPLAAGDNVEVEVAGVGILRNPVVASGS